MTPTPSPFAFAAAYYDRFRAPYPPEALDYVTAAFGGGGDSRVLDLGCGPGTLSIPLSRAVGEVVAVDPDGAMLAEGKRLASQSGRDNIRWAYARAEDIGPDLGRFRIAILGQSFHWMDRDRVLDALSRLVEDGGGLVLINPGKRRPQESWEPVAGAVVAKYLGRRDRHPAANPEPAHEPSLRRSACFAAFTAREFPSQITRDVASIIGCLYSTSGASRPLFGERVAAFEAELTQALLRLEPSGVFREQLETEVLLAPKRAG